MHDEKHMLSSYMGSINHVFGSCINLINIIINYSLKMDEKVKSNSMYLDLKNNEIEHFADHKSHLTFFLNILFTSVAY